jgi:hypothetical protein
MAWLDMKDAPTENEERFFATDGKVVAIVRKHPYKNPDFWMRDGEDVEYDAYGITDPCIDVYSLTGWQPLPKP